MTYTTYISLGDSMSIDRYPALELNVRQPGRYSAAAGQESPVGAASLFYRNDAALWPEFDGRDLTTRHPGIERLDLTMDGATVGDVFSAQLPELSVPAGPAVVTLTVGGNDLLSAYAAQHGKRVLERAARDIAESYELVVRAVREAVPEGVLILATVYDPSDRTGRIPGLLGDETDDKLPLQHLDTLNARIRETARRTPGARLADVYVHFLGHGMTAPPMERWYWASSPIEPGAAGASEIRRVWWEALGEG
ncbi:MAG TPA: SGNH/GDSL hydrolase family protein [Gemmatimonadaceae bacterium]|nr:SGNH/GDSL hydrolase family protein [Gemmatimonadaceae bacterium]